MSYKLAIAIPTFNRAQLLNEILWNICPQINRYSSECACYIIDNCSSDNTEETIKEHQRRCANLFYHKNYENVGLVRNISCAITIPDAEWVWLIGDDDIPMPYSVGVILADILSLNYNKINFLMLEGAKVDENQILLPKFQHNCSSDNVVTIFENGAEIISVAGIHGIAWLSVLVVNRSLWDQQLFDKIYRETDLYTFVRVLLKTATKTASAYSKRFVVMATDRGSRAYYFSKTAIARVCEFPEIESMLVDHYGFKMANKFLKTERKAWVKKRLGFVIKMAVFKDAYLNQQHLLKQPISPFISERLSIMIIAKICQVSIIKNKLTKIYNRIRGNKSFDDSTINSSV